MKQNQQNIENFIKLKNDQVFEIFMKFEVHPLFKNLNNFGMFYCQRK